MTRINKCPAVHNRLNREPCRDSVFLASNVRQFARSRELHALKHGLVRYLHEMAGGATHRARAPRELLGVALDVPTRGEDVRNERLGLNKKTNRKENLKPVAIAGGGGGGGVRNSWQTRTKLALDAPFHASKSKE